VEYNLLSLKFIPEIQAVKQIKGEQKLISNRSRKIESLRTFARLLLFKVDL